MGAFLSRRHLIWVGVSLAVIAGVGLFLRGRDGSTMDGSVREPVTPGKDPPAAARYGKARARQAGARQAGGANEVPDEKKRSIQAHGDELLACGQNEWCPPGTICYSLPDGSGIGCYGSNCKSMRDDSCGPGRSCMLLGPGPRPVYRCAPAGNQPLGAVCSDEYPGPKDRVCAAGLVCWNGKCRAPCNAAGACDGKGRCVAVSQRDSVCVEDACESNGDCGADHTCYAPPVEELEKSKTCVRLAKLVDGKPSCTMGSCPRGFACDAAIVDGEFRGRCRKTCSEVPAEPCPPGFVCGAAGIQGVSDAPSACYVACEFYTASEQCRSDEVCATMSEEMSHTRTGCRWKIVDLAPSGMVGLTGVFTDPTPPQPK